MSPNRTPFTAKRLTAPWAGVAVVAGALPTWHQGAAPTGQQMPAAGGVNTASPRLTAL